jgi:hypothetical protein
MNFVKPLPDKGFELNYAPANGTVREGKIKPKFPIAGFH